jgi:hypothetical protein
MTDVEIDALMASNGLQHAFALFPEELRAAARQAESQRAALDPIVDPTQEPWPPMRTAL